MAFTIDMTQAANRHIAVADKLDASNMRPAAAYSYGLAAECAVKAVLKALRVPEPKPPAKNGPYYAHFPDLRTLLVEVVTGRGSAVLAPFTKDDFMSGWDIVVRYAKASELVGPALGLDARYSSWRENAKRAIAAMGEV